MCVLLFSREVMSDSFATPWTVALHASFFVRGISQIRIQEWVAISFSRGCSQPGIEPSFPALAGASREAWGVHTYSPKSSGLVFADSVFVKTIKYNYHKQ